MAAAEELTENVIEPAETLGTATAKVGEALTAEPALATKAALSAIGRTVLIISRTLLRVGKDLIGFIDFLKFLLGPRGMVDVRVIFF